MECLPQSRSWFEELDSSPVWATLGVAFVVAVLAVIPIATHMIMVLNCECRVAIVDYVGHLAKTGVKKLLVFMLPRLFSEKKVEIETDTVCDVLHFMDRPLECEKVTVGPLDRDSNESKSFWCSCCTFLVFAILALSILCMTGLAFFRYFPIEKSNECKEYDSNFRTLYCFTNASDLPVNCVDIDNDTEVICYAYHLDLSLAIGTSYGLMKFAGLLVTAGVYAAKLWMEVCTKLGRYHPRRCRSTWKCCMSAKCSTLCFIVLFSGGLCVVGGFATYFIISDLNQRASRMPATTGEIYYDLAYIFMLIFVLPIFFLCIPCFVCYHKDRPTWTYPATQDPGEQTRSVSEYETEL